MADNLKQFIHLDSQSVEGDITIVETTESTQAVVKDILFKGKSTHYPTELTLKLGGKLLGETYTSAEGEELNVSLSGSQIVDKESTLEINLPPITELPSRVAKLNAMIFSNGWTNKILDTNPEVVDVNTPYTNIEVQSHLWYDSNQGSGQNLAQSAFAVIREGEVQYFRLYGSTLLRHNQPGSAVETAFTVTLSDGTTPAVTQSMCTDGTYFYEKSATASTEIRVYNVSDYVQQDSIITNVSYAGQASNQGSYMLTHDGYIYTKQYAESRTIYKTKIEDGTTTTIGGRIITAAVSNGGSGYSNGTHQLNVIDNGVGAVLGGSGGVLEITIAGGSITTATVYNPGGGYIESFTDAAAGGLSALSGTGATLSITTEPTPGAHASGYYVGTHSAGAVITRGSNGTFYLVEKGSDGWYKVNLTNENIFSFASNGLMNESTEYGNAGFEISGGYVGFINGGDLVIIDVVDGSYAVTKEAISIKGYGEPSVAYGAYCSVAALSISQNIDDRTKDLNYSIYAAGIAVTAVTGV